MANQPQEQNSMWKPTIWEIVIVAAVVAAIVGFVLPVLFSDLPTEVIAPASPAPQGA